MGDSAAGLNHQDPKIVGWFHSPGVVLRLRMGPHIVRNEGPLGLFKGVDASMARQLVYSGVSWQMGSEADQMKLEP